MRRRKIILAINGINTWPGDSKNWNLRFGVWVDMNCDENVRAHAVEYFCDALGRAVGQKNRCLKVVELIGEYEDWDIDIVGHSNGCAVAIEALRLAGWPRIGSLHLVSGACEARFDKNGLNVALINRHIDRVFVYVSGRDMALRLASEPLARLLGYGNLGLHGPLNVASVLGPGRVSTIDDGPWMNYGHSGCWQESEFDTTCRLLTQP